MIQTTNYQELLEVEHTQSHSDSQNFLLWEEFLYIINLTPGTYTLLSAKACPLGKISEGSVNGD